jgi:hypothetical protein
MHEAALPRPADFIGRRVVGQVQRHQRLEFRALGNRGDDPLPIRLRHRGSRHRRLQIRHDDRATELARSVRQHGGQHFAVANVQMPVVRTGERKGIEGNVGSGHGKWGRGSAAKSQSTRSNRHVAA